MVKQLFQPAHAGEERRGSAGRPGRSNSVPVVASPLSDPTVVLGAFQWKVSLDALPPQGPREPFSYRVLSNWFLAAFVSKAGRCGSSRCQRSLPQSGWERGSRAVVSGGVEASPCPPSSHGRVRDRFCRTRSAFPLLPLKVLCQESHSRLRTFSTFVSSSGCFGTFTGNFRGSVGLKRTTDSVSRSLS